MQEKGVYSQACRKICHILSMQKVLSVCLCLRLKGSMEILKSGKLNWFSSANTNFADRPSDIYCVGYSGLQCTLPEKLGFQPCNQDAWTLSSGFLTSLMGNLKHVLRVCRAHSMK